MADNPYGITQVDVPGLMQNYIGLQRQQMQDRMLQSQFLRQQKLDSRADTEYEAQQKADALIANGAPAADVIKAHPATGFAYATHAASIGKAQREAQAQRADDVGSAALYLSNLPDKDMAAQWDGVIDKLVSAGYTDLAPYKGQPNRAALGPIISESDKAVKAYAAHLEHDSDAAARDKHNHFMEGIAARGAATSEGNLALSKQREARVTKWGPQPLIGVMNNVPDSVDDLNY